jgi:hypothetical protein
MARTNAERIVFLTDIRDQIENRLAQMVASPKVTYNVDGQMFDFNGYQKLLFEQLEKLDSYINSMDTGTGKLAMTQVFTGG